MARGALGALGVKAPVWVEDFLDAGMDQALNRLEAAIEGLLDRLDAEREARAAADLAMKQVRLGIDAAALEIRAALSTDGPSGSAPDSLVGAE